MGSWGEITLLIVYIVINPCITRKGPPCICRVFSPAKHRVVFVVSKKKTGQTAVASEVRGRHVMYKTCPKVWDRNPRNGAGFFSRNKNPALDVFKIDKFLTYL